MFFLGGEAMVAFHIDSMLSAAECGLFPWWLAILPASALSRIFPSSFFGSDLWRFHCGRASEHVSQRSSSICFKIRYPKSPFNLMKFDGNAWRADLNICIFRGWLCSIQWGCCGDKVASNHTATKHHHAYPFLPWVLLKTGDLSKNMRNMVLFRQNPPWFGSSPGPKNCNPSLQEAGSVTGSFANLRGLVTSQRQGSEARWHRKTTGIQEIAKLLQLVQMTWSIFGGPSKIYWL